MADVIRCGWEKSDLLEPGEGDVARMEVEAGPRLGSGVHRERLDVVQASVSIHRCLEWWTFVGLGW